MAPRAIFEEAEAVVLSYKDVRAGDLHRRVGGYPQPNHRMPTCCHAMYQAKCFDDKILQALPKGKDALLTIRYKLPRMR